MWFWNKCFSAMTTKGDYDAIIGFSNVIMSKWWYKHLWNQYMTLRIKCFSWICMENWVLTKDNINIRGIVGPNLCVLCKKVEENAENLFFTYGFYISVWFEDAWAHGLFYRWTLHNILHSSTMYHI